MENLDSKSLMIGDWVICHHPTQQQEIVTVTSGLLLIVERQENGIIDNNSPLYRIVKPIPLTEEILKKNGFEYMNDEYGCWVMSKVELREREPYNGLFEVEILISEEIVFLHYVHELQHVLRLCKIDKEIEL